jgi:hypothetical protein
VRREHEREEIKLNYFYLSSRANEHGAREKFRVGIVVAAAAAAEANNKRCFSISLLNQQVSPELFKLFFNYRHQVCRLLGSDSSSVTAIS